MKNITPLILITLVLAACAGGGGSGGMQRSVSSTSYSGSSQLITYSDGSTSTNSAISSSVSWASDNITKTTIYTFSDGTTHTETISVQPTIAYSYSEGFETTTTTYATGHITSTTASAVSNSVAWASDNITKTTTYTFGGGRTNSVTETVTPTVTTPALTSANYPMNWTSGALVTPPSVSSKATLYGNGYSVAIEDGSVTKPFNQTTLSTLSISDPSSFVTSATTTYDLRWGVPDTMGPALAASFSNTKITLGSPISYVGIPVTSYTSLSNGPTLYSPTSEVKSAWTDGWTGKDKNILLIDGYTGSGTTRNHGVTTMMLTDLIAINASKFALDYGFTGTTPTGTLLNISGNTVTTSTAMHVINASFGFNWWANPSLDPNSLIDVNTARTNSSAGTTTWRNVLNGTTSVANLDVSNAVITKSAGNDAVDSAKEPYVYAYASDSNINPRLLIVGATIGDGTTSSKTTIATYSNTAGTNTDVSSRFLVANGKSPYDTGDVGINGYTVNSGAGTSYAAPRVAGYVAILRHKFPNLNAEKSASVILDTARYDTLTCFPTCDTSIYGKGEASLSRALAPVGRLR